MKERNVNKMSLKKKKIPFGIFKTRNKKKIQDEGVVT